MILSRLIFACCLRYSVRAYYYVLCALIRIYIYIYIFSHFCFPASGQAVVTGVVPSPPLFLPSIFIAHGVQQSHYSSIFHRVLLTHALALSASQFVLKKKFQRNYTRMHSAGLELTKLTYTMLEDNLIRSNNITYGLATHISQLTQLMPSSETYQSETGSQP